MPNGTKQKLIRAEVGGFQTPQIADGAHPKQVIGLFKNFLILNRSAIAEAAGFSDEKVQARKSKQKILRQSLVALQRDCREQMRHCTTKLAPATS